MKKKGNKIPVKIEERFFGISIKTKIDVSEYQLAKLRKAVRDGSTIRVTKNRKVVFQNEIKSLERLDRTKNRKYTKVRK